MVLEPKMQELKEMSDTLLHLVSHGHGDGRPDRPLLTTLGSAGAVDSLPRARNRRNSTAFGRLR